MREIKFRGKRIDNGEWVYGFYSESYGLDSKMHSYISCPHNRMLNKHHEVHHETVGQFTGLNDNNGVEIYEGDKIIFPDLDRNNYKVVFWKDSSWEYFNLHHIGHCSMEVIGNIHEVKQEPC